MAKIITLTIGVGVIDDYEPFDETVTQIDAWYDKHQRLWVIELLNKDGFQVGDAVIGYGKQWKDLTVAELKEEYGIK